MRATRGGKRMAACACALMLGVIAQTCSAQTSMSAGVVSDYRYRGMSLSEERPVAQLSLNHDSANGMFAGVSLSGASLPYARTNGQAIGYAGLARGFGEGMAWEIGALQTAFLQSGRYNYHELFVGLNTEHGGARLYVSPGYLGVGGRSVYGEINASHPLSDRIDLVGHLGYLRPTAPAGWPRSLPLARADLRIGAAATLDAWSLQLGWSATREGAALYPGAYGARARQLVLGAARHF